MAKHNLTKIQKKVKKHMDKERFAHTLGVRYMCAALAMRYGYDIEKAELAGILHDCAKEIPDEEKIRLCQEYNIPVTRSEENNPYLLHAKLGAFLAREKYQVHDYEVLNAILYHTTGRENMDLLEKIVYVADYIEPGRFRAKNLARIRKLAFIDLDEALYFILRDTIDYLDQKQADKDPQTEYAFTFYQKKTMEQ